MKTDKQKRILIVDDEEVIRVNLSDILKENGYLTDVAVSGRQAITRNTVTRNTGSDTKIDISRRRFK